MIICNYGFAACQRQECKLDFMLAGLLLLLLHLVIKSKLTTYKVIIKQYYLFGENTLHYSKIFANYNNDTNPLAVSKMSKLFLILF